MDARQEEIRKFLSSADGKKTPKLDAELNAIMGRYKEVATRDEIAAEVFESMLALGGDNFANYFERYGNILTRFGFDQVTMIGHLEDTFLEDPPRFVQVMGILEFHGALHESLVQEWLNVRDASKKKKTLVPGKLALLDAYLEDKSARQLK
ncbi:uncharacterized protein LOC111831655 [Capsella rubella]|uniref:uncharacterized protein LOC111831655 n=1 Tax=Capsella rubella TaxID=81985 RepID=UPI000CD4CA6A|nr:uncharacterized protein LOC111831655 [Capsella rubella]